jgi:DNA-directed RNA polymerase
LNKIYIYLHEISRILTNFNLPIFWVTPSGVKINQRYYTSISKTIPISFGGRNKKVTIRKWT